MTVKSMTRKELAAACGWSTKTFRRRMEQYGLDFGSERILTARQVAQFYRVVGPPEVEVDKD